MLKSIIKNNLIAVAIHICMCIILILPIGFIWFYGVWGNNMELNRVIINWLLIGACTTVILFLYFWTGRKFLTNTGQSLTNVLSVIAVLILIIIGVFISLYLDASNRWHIMWMLMTPISPLGETLSHFARIELKYADMLMSILLPLAMWIGMITKRVV